MRWVALIKFRYHVTFIGVVCGALLFAPAIDSRLAGRLLLLYLTFNVMLYGGIYTLNDVADRAADAGHPRKRHRPVASGAVSVRSACLFASALIATGALGAVLFFPTDVAACFGAALALNAAYSLGARDHRYLDLLFNSLTHPNRFLMGALLTDRVPPASHLAAILLLAIALSCLRRQVEQASPGADARATLSRYAAGELAGVAAICLVLLAGLASFVGHAAPGFYLIVGATTLIIVVGGWLPTTIRSGLRAIWTR